MINKPFIGNEENVQFMVFGQLSAATACQCVNYDQCGTIQFQLANAVATVVIYHFHCNTHTHTHTHTHTQTMHIVIDDSV